MNRISTVVKQKVNTLLDRYEDPKEALDYSYVKQTEMLNKLRRNVAEVKTAKMKAKSQALDEMIDSGVLTDYTSNKDDTIERELEQTTTQRSVDEELAKLKAERAKKKKLDDEHNGEEEEVQVSQ